MAKSTRSKVKRAFRSKKRETGVYAATEAARLNRLNSKLVQIAKRQGEEEKGEEDILGAMAIDGQKSERISTHGPRGSRRDEWRMSKGLDPRPKPTGMNRQGGIAARRKSGRSKRRR
ncbi:hypothetical protein K443DRAFT_85081 [Laccaria amethystina LaAM-08-1]|uniref:DUF2423 domain-containing protein n=1 Tax=Laccaria amethystina LaAM-08-1 TaxID=1095629 RepID=A0A0C9X8P0_9AGAR|nr:hypothetical protein K443DRAFT_85081 [Laccaria amethystina LaAM-08-1]